MTGQLDEKRAVAGAGRGSVWLELRLGERVLAAGAELAGVVVVRAARPTRMRSLTVTLSGCEIPARTSLARPLGRPAYFLEREALLSGMLQPRFTSERVAQFWNALLGRETGRMLSPGEHIYPFAISLPSSLPPSYHGRAGRIVYAATARAQVSPARALKAAASLRVVAVPRPPVMGPATVSYPSAGGTPHPGEITVNLELAQRAVRLGESVHGRLVVGNPRQAEIRGVSVSLEKCERVRLASDRELQRDELGSCAITPEEPTARAIEAGFELAVPADAAPTVEGTSISVIWLLRLSIDTDPPIEIKTPVVVCEGPSFEL